MSLYGDCREQIQTLLEGVTDIGVVHDYERFDTGDYVIFLDQFVTTIGGTDQVRGWWISSPGYRGAYAEQGAVHRTLDFTIRGVQSVRDDDATEKTFRDLCETVVHLFDDPANRTLSGTANHVGPANMPTFEPRLFKDVLCHYAEITVPAIVIRPI